jgi:uncharacterized protein (UPF0276 family)
LVEVLAEGCFGRDPRRREALALAERWPVIPHGLKLSLGSAGGIDRERARQLGQLARELRAPFISEHVAFTSASGREIGHLIPLPLTHEAVDVVARNVAAAQRELPDVPLLLENAAWTLRWPQDALDEGSFYHEVIHRTGCLLLLDLGNVYANAYNSGVEPLQLLRSYPLERVGMIHLAGGRVRDGFYIDTHAHPLPAAVLELLAAALPRCGPVPIIIERDAEFPPFAESMAEVQAARAVVNQVFPGVASPGATTLAPPQAEVFAGQPSPTVPPRGGNATAPQALLQAQAELCELLLAPPPLKLPRLPFAPVAIARTREVLRRKRFGEALALLPQLTKRRDTLWPLVDGQLEATPRPARGTAIADAFQVAECALAARELAAAARQDLLLLRSRFVVDRDGPRARRGPFLGRIALPDGRWLWACKSAGPTASVHLYPCEVAIDD